MNKIFYFSPSWAPPDSFMTEKMLQIVCWLEVWWSPSSQSAALWNVSIVSAATFAPSVNLACSSTKESVWPAAQREPLPTKLTAWVSKTLYNYSVYYLEKLLQKKVQLLSLIIKHLQIQHTLSLSSSTYDFSIITCIVSVNDCHL